MKLKLRRLAEKEKPDIKSMRYFIPRRNLKKGWRITGKRLIEMRESPPGGSV